MAWLGGGRKVACPQLLIAEGRPTQLFHSGNIF